MPRINYLPNEIIDILEKCRNKLLLDETFIANFERNSMQEMPLHIGVIGKMNAGKSTLLNALIFKDNILGMSVVPMTAVLTEISYNEDSETVVEVDFFNDEDIECLKNAIDDNAEECERCKEHLEAICAIDGYESKLGLSLNISIAELNEYTSTEGTMSALVKRVKIKYHHEALRGITIVDTPGFNDPIQSRVEATKMAIKNCQVLIFVHSTISHYDKSEVAMLKSQVEFAGTAKLIDVANRVDDLPIEEWFELKELIVNAKNNLISSATLGGHVLSLLQNSHTEYVSALMALLGSRFENKADVTQEETQMASILCQDFDISTDDFIEYSNISSVVNLVNSIAQNKDALKQSSLPNKLRGELINTKDSLTNKVAELIKCKGVLSSSVKCMQDELSRIEGIKLHIKKFFGTQELYARLSNLISRKKEELLSDRDSRSSKHFIDANYENYTLRAPLSNIARYNDFVDNYIRYLRRNLNDFKVSSFRVEVDAYLNSLEESLVSNGFGGQLLGTFMNEVRSLIARIFEDICIIEYYALKNKLKGNPQKDMYRYDFNQHFTDSYITNTLLGVLTNIQSSFDFSQGLDRNAFARDVSLAADNLIANMRKAIQDPSEKEKQLKDIELDISNLNEKIKEIDSCINSLDSYIN